jgi:HEPN domain-containing protein
VSEGDRAREAAFKWLEYARADLLEARINVEHGGSPFVGCFHAQQAVEKAIKALYVLGGHTFDRTHDLDRLSDLLPGEWSFRTEFPDLSSLTYWSVQGRYPGDLPMASAEDAKTALNLASRVFGKIEEELLGTVGT